MTGTGAGELTELAESIFTSAAKDGAVAGRSVDDTGLDAELWATLDQAGLARLTLPETVGGSAGTLIDAAAVLVAAGAHAARVPLVETDLLAGWLLHAAGLAVPAGPLTAVAAPLDVQRSGDGWAVRGVLSRVPWARAAAGIVVLTGGQVVSLEPAAVTLVEGTNLAGEPRDRVVVDLVPAPVAGSSAGAAAEPRLRAAVAPAPVGAAAELRLRAALGRALLLAGAARGALGASVRYAGERVQFGRPIARFQAVQQQLALAAEEVAAAGAAAEAAARVAERDGFGAGSTSFVVAAAKARTSEAAGVVARIAHQVHGAIGFTREHALRLLTTRLWAWRDEDGAEAEWQAELGARVLAAGPNGLWPLLTGDP